MPTDATTDDPAGGYAIGAVARLTGISVHTLRVWERRHHAVELQRSAGGRRVYSTGDIERLVLMKQLVDRGERISQIAGLAHSQLQARLDEFVQHTERRLDAGSGRHRVAIFGDFIGVNLKDDLSGVDIVAHAQDINRFRSDVRKSRPQVLVIELPVVNPPARQMVAELRRLCSADRVAVVYGFGRRDDIGLLATEADALLRAPICGADLQRALGPAPQLSETKETAIETTVPTTLDEAPARRYTRNQLARMATLPADVECECPAHLVELVDRLTVFEDYSADCENRNPADAALHAYLHTATANARFLIETALARVAEAEGIDPGPP